MELIKDPKCYTDLCLNGKWFHHDHCTTKAYMLHGGACYDIELNKMPTTESELEELLMQAL
ncbi:hypothetical protein L4D09_28540 [Photobacterium makurazakiensis]|uniref:hypothetical protein n=1 Tax=Photobacterium makurazakiensis TaxID=2910234 RepID=UPI003D137423